MDNVMWVIIAAVVAIALAGIVIFVGGDGLGNFDDRKNETTTSQLCDFQASEVEAGRLDCSNINSRCEGSIPRCS
jgi:hypothetical protein